MFFAGCKSGRQRDITAEECTVKKIEVYEVKEWLYPILDSVIKEAKDSSIYEISKKNVEFSFDIGFNCSIEYVDLAICLRDSMYSYKNAKWTDAIFYYKGYEFYCGNVFLDYFFYRTNNTVSLRCKDSKYPRLDTVENNVPNLEWFYSVKIKDN